MVNSIRYGFENNNKRSLNILVETKIYYVYTIWGFFLKFYENYMNIRPYAAMSLKHLNQRRAQTRFKFSSSCRKEYITNGIY